jgi:ferredoxin
MTTREGSLEAPTRHPIDWRNPEFFDHAALEKEQERIFEICHGCRRCVSLCGAFPTLFDLIDEGKSGEIDGVAKKDFVKVVDQCYLCDLCYMTKCPYVPPHPWNVDFPHLMLRAKAVKFRDGDVSFRDKAPDQHRPDRQARDDPGGRRVREQGEHDAVRAQGDGEDVGRGRGVRAASLRQGRHSARTPTRVSHGRYAPARAHPGRLRSSPRAT